MRTFFFFLFTLKMMEISLGLPKLEFFTGKKHFTSGKKSRKITLPPQKNMPVTPLCYIINNSHFNRYICKLYHRGHKSNHTSLIKIKFTTSRIISTLTSQVNYYAHGNKDDYTVVSWWSITFLFCRLVVNLIQLN